MIGLTRRDLLVVVGLASLGCRRSPRPMQVTLGVDGMI